MAEILLKKENVDGMSKLWLPDAEKCTAQEELRRIEEWKHKNDNGIKKPSELGIDAYRYGNSLHPKFLEGRNPPPVALDSAENLEWYAEQLHRCIYGFEYKGTRLTGDFYWFLNFTPFAVMKKDGNGEIMAINEINFPYFSYQHDYIFKLMEEAHEYGKGFMLMGSRGYGKALVDSELVMTPTGKVLNGSLKKGDLVYGSDGKPTSVKEVYPQGKLDVYQIELKDGRKIRCSYDHLWDVYIVNKSKHEILTTKDMINDFVSIRKQGKDHKYFVPTGNGADYDKKHYFIQPYTLGALLGDGSFGKYGTRLVIVEHETEILDHIIDIEGISEGVEYSHNYNTPYKGAKEIDRVFFKKESGLTAELGRLNLSGVHTFDKFIPKEYMYGSRAQRMELLRGLMDTDGYCSKAGDIEFTNTSKSLAEDILDLARSLGIKGSISEELRPDRPNAHIIYRVRFYTGEPIFHLKRKLKRINSSPSTRIKNGRDRTAIVDIKKLDYKEHSTCITVDAKDSLYLTADYTVTHNTYMVLSVIAKYYYLRPDSNNYVSASHSGHANEAFGKLKRMLLAIDKAHPTLALARLTDTKYVVKSGYEVNIDGVKREEGPMSTVKQVIYGDNSGVTRGSRPDTQLMEECMAPGTKVLMADKKYKFIEDIVVGDKILTAGFIKRRIGKITNGTAEMFEVSQSIGKPYVVNGTHKLRLAFYDEFGDLRKINISVNDFIEREDQDYFYGVRIDNKLPDISVKSIGVGDYYGFTIKGEKEEDHLFILSDGTVTHNCGDWSTGKADLKSCITASVGSWRKGPIKTCRVFLTGTGGSVSSDQAKDVFTNPDAYDLLAVDDFSLKAGKKHAVFIPADYLYGSFGWERTGVNDNVGAKESLEEERELKKDDLKAQEQFVQEYPFTVEEVFRKSGTNIFHQRNIAKQWSDMEFDAEHIMKPEIGFLEWKRSLSGTIAGVTWAANPNGNISILEHPYHGKNGDNIFPDLYIGGIDSIDQGQLDSTTNKQRSSLAILIKKRIVDGEYFKQTSNLYVAKYIGRSLDVRDDYEEALKLSMYYSAKVNVEYTKIGIVQYFRERKQWHRLIKRPMIAKSSSGSGDPVHIQKLREQTLIGTTTTPGVIDYGDGKIKEYTRDFCHNIFFVDLLEQLRDYQREDRKRYDLVVAMALCEIADEDLLGIPARTNNADTRGFEEFGYYIDDSGKKKFGTIPNTRKKINDFLVESKVNGFRWIDMRGLPRFDDKFDVLDVRDLKNTKT